MPADAAPRSSHRLDRTTGCFHSMAASACARLSATASSLVGRITTSVTTTSTGCPASLLAQPTRRSHETELPTFLSLPRRSRPRLGGAASGTKYEVRTPEGGEQHGQAEQVCAVEGWEDAVVIVVVKGSEVQGREHPGQGLSAAHASDRAIARSDAGLRLGPAFSAPCWFANQTQESTPIAMIDGLAPRHSGRKAAGCPIARVGVFRTRNASRRETRRRLPYSMSVKERPFAALQVELGA